MTQPQARHRTQLVAGGKFLPLIGVGSFTCSGTAIASLVTGVTGPS